MKHYDERTLAGLIPYPKPGMNKYTRGKLTLIVGSHTYPGAAGLASLASQRAGAGYTEVYVEDGIVPLLQMYHTSLVVHPWSGWHSSQLKASTESHPCAYVIGSGFDAQDPYVSGLTRHLLHDAQAPVLVDGGALRLLSAKKIHDLCEQRFRMGFPTIVTPHGGEAKEMGRIFALTTQDQGDFALQLSQAYGAITVLKGPDTYISDGVDVHCMSEGTAALAKAGTGDVLAGTIGAFLAQGMGPIDACVLGTTVHARAGRLAEKDLTSVSVCAEDVITYLPKAIMSIADSAKHKHDDDEEPC